jgi:tetratricopeptide (TPR) repeat protein
MSSSEHWQRSLDRNGYLNHSWMRGLITVAALTWAITAVMAAEGPNALVRILSVQGKVEVARSGQQDWILAKTDMPLKPGDQVRTARRSKATLQMSDKTVLKIRQLTTMVIQASPSGEQMPELNLKSGSVFFFSRESPKEVPFRTSLTSGAIRGTEFELSVTEDDTTTLTMLDGLVDIRSGQGEVAVTNGEQAVIAPGQAPQKTAMLDASAVVQWTLYYPGILDASELEWINDLPEAAWNRALEDYRNGNLPAAIAHMPTLPADGEQEAARLLRASIWLAHGEISMTETLLDREWDRPKHRILAMVLGHFISTMRDANTTPSAPDHTENTSTGMLVASYQSQLSHDLDQAILWTRMAVELSPDFGYAWARLATLNFALGDHTETQKALEQAIVSSSENAQVRVLQGFIDLANNRHGAALAYMEEAIQLDAGLSNAWLGRGLTQFRMGNRAEGRQDLQAATILEPQRSMLRSYLGKAYHVDKEFVAAGRELERAKLLDPNDPTPWLYIALIHYQQNRLISAITSLQESIRLNDNRGVYRSRSLLDKDQSIRQANLASLYQDAHMHTWSRLEAARSVESDYTNASAHLFLANSYNALRDPRQLNLRYETPWASELFLAQMLMPAGTANLSRQIAQNEYSSLFNQPSLHLSNTSEYQSSGRWDQSTSHFGNLSGMSYAVDFQYLSHPGQRPNNDVEHMNLWTSAKFSLTPQDELMLQAVYSDYTSGDVAQYHTQTDASTTQRIQEDQEPLLFLGYHRTWHPGSHTLLLASYFDDTFTRQDPGTIVPLMDRGPDGNITAVNPFTFDLDYRRQLTGFSLEAQQILQAEQSTTIAGARYQWAEVNTHAMLDRRGTAFPPIFSKPPADQTVRPNIERVSVYGYYHHDLTEQLKAYLGASADALHHPANTEIPPISEEEEDTFQISPKLGLRYSPQKQTHLRASYAWNLGGVFFDQSLRLEPTQMAGFINTYRSVIPESSAGILPGEKQEVGGLAWDQQFGDSTFLTVSGQWLQSDAQRTLGTFDFASLPAQASGTPQGLDYEERSLLVAFNQLIDPWFYTGANYRLSYATLDTVLNSIPSAALPSRTSNREAHLHQLECFVGVQHPSGFFARLESVWSRQSHKGAVQPSDEDVWQWHAWAGYRFLERRAEVAAGLLNIGDKDYQLHPVHLYSEIPRERTLAARLRINF